MNLQDTPDEINRYRSGISLTAGQITGLQKRLTELLASVPARLIVLVELTGQFVTAVGELHDIDVDALGSLMAGDMAASQEIARLTGEYQDFSLVLREGVRSQIIIAEAGNDLMFLVQIGREVPIGWARKLIQKAAVEIGAMAAYLPPESEDPNSDALDSLGQDGLTDLFNDALDDLWKG
jgi:predicted regulator of Ras-like GTPase activity (Roadblock/LC7/MglB family)